MFLYLLCRQLQSLWANLSRLAASIRSGEDLCAALVTDQRTDQRVIEQRDIYALSC